MATSAVLGAARYAPICHPRTVLERAGHETLTWLHGAVADIGYRRDVSIPRRRGAMSHTHRSSIYSYSVADLDSQHVVRIGRFGEHVVHDPSYAASLLALRTGSFIAFANVAIDRFASQAASRHNNSGAVAHGVVQGVSDSNGLSIVRRMALIAWFKTCFLTELAYFSNQSAWSSFPAAVAGAIVPADVGGLSPSAAWNRIYGLMKGVKPSLYHRLVWAARSDADYDAAVAFADSLLAACRNNALDQWHPPGSQTRLPPPPPAPPPAPSPTPSQGSDGPEDCEDLLAQLSSPTPSQTPGPASDLSPASYPRPYIDPATALPGETLSDPFLD